MYTAQIIEKDTVRGVLRLTVEFSNGTDLFTEILSFSDPTKDIIDNAIDDILKRANKAEAFQVAELSKHPVKETVENDFKEKKQKEKEEREKPKEELKKETSVEEKPVEKVKQ